VPLFIIGSGPAGYTAAIYGARALLTPVLASGSTPGGQLMITTDVENYPGFPQIIQGPWLMGQMREHAQMVGTRIVDETVVEAKLSQRPFSITLESGSVYTCDALIIATGAQAQWLGIPSETFFRGFGVSACATCDGFFFQNQNVCVIGGGNTAVEEALYLSRIAREVTLIHRRDSLRAERVLQERLKACTNVHILWNHMVSEIVGTEKPKGVQGVRIRHVKTGQETLHKTDGVFIAIGHKPASGLFVNDLDCDSSGYIRVEKGTTATSVPGVFAAGDVADFIYRQAVTAAGLGCMAALDAERWILSQAAEAYCVEGCH
jgi:thioredoxin reductase (NADPH)